MKRYAVGLVLALVTLAAAAGEKRPSPAEAGWPRWRGPLANGVAPHGNPPVEWSEQKNVRWKAAVPGLGHATPVVWGRRIFVLTAVETDREGDAAAIVEEEKKLPEFRRRGARGTTRLHDFDVLCLNLDDGKTIWKRTVRTELPHEGTHKEGSWATASPVTDGECVIAYFGSRGLYCLDMDGKVKWEKDFGDMQVKMRFGEGISPALHGNAVIVHWDHIGDDFIIALDRKTGAEIWKKDRDEITSWSTPLVVEHKGVTQVIVSATGRVRGYDLKDGRVIWECGGLTGNVVPHPVYANGIVYVMSGFRGAAAMGIALDKAKGDVTGSEAVVWTLDKNTPYCPSPFVYDRYLYFMARNNGILSCYDITTHKPLFGPQKLEGMRMAFASPAGASERVYIVGRDGLTYVLKLGPAFEVLAKNKLDDSFTASPVIVGTDLLLRGHGNLYCISSK